MQPKYLFVLGNQPADFVRHYNHSIHLLISSQLNDFFTFFPFFRYYSGEKTAPVLTIFIGGNHEASNYLQELPYGGWVAPKIYYLGKNNVSLFSSATVSEYFHGVDEWV